MNTRVRSAATAIVVGIAISGATLSRAHADAPPPVGQLNEGTFQFTGNCAGTNFTYALRFHVLSDGSIEINTLQVYDLGRPPTVQPVAQYALTTLYPDGSYASSNFTPDATMSATGTWTGAFTSNAKGLHFSFSTTPSGSTCISTGNGTFGPVPPGL